MTGVAAASDNENNENWLRNEASDRGCVIDEAGDSHCKMKEENHFAKLKSHRM